MTGALKHRGPDAGGTCSFSRCVLGHRRLSILDLSDAANQPMLSPDGRIALVFNGEIYNFRELRRDLESRGHTFRTRSDTEVLLELYIDQQESMLEMLNGMFSLAIWDERQGRALLARDRVGKKPLYYYCEGGRLGFSSELSSLLCDDDAPRSLSRQGFVEFLLYDFIPAPHTIFDGICKLPAGHFALFDREGIRIRRYWKPPLPEPADHYSRRRAELGDILSDAVGMRLVADVPLGSFLSGGMDSTLVASFMTGHGGAERVKTFSISFPGTSYDESPWARLAAASLGTDHREYAVEYDVQGLLPDLVRHFGEPFGDSSAIPTWHLCRETRQHVTVALSGDGGDELFGGYERYLARRVQLVYDLLPRALRERLIEPFIDRLPATTDYYGTSLTKKLKLFLSAARRFRENPDAVAPRTFSRGEVLRLTGLDYDATADPVLQTARELPDVNPVSRMMLADLQTYLAEDILTKVDRMSMAHALEVRCPLLDHRVVELACSLPLSFKMRGQTSKRILRDVAQGRVPREILARSKYGFQVPIGEWFKGELKQWAQGRLLEFNHTLFLRKVVENLWQEHQRGKADHTHRLWLLVVFNEWYDQFGH